LSWIILEGLDRTGKSSVSEMYKKRGYKVIHMSAPDKKYIQDGYVGPSYLDDLLEMYMQYDDQDVVFDRSPYGELVWPHVYGRKPLLEEDDIDILREFEDRNSAQRILMIDPDTKAHWQRCVDNKEPMNHIQFNLASKLFTKLAHKYSFIPKELGDFNGLTETERKNSPAPKQEKPVEVRQDQVESDDVESDSGEEVVYRSETSISRSPEQEKLEKANAINSILSKRIIKQKGPIFDKLESDIKKYLNKQLSSLLGNNADNNLTDDEILVLKVFCQRLKEKQKGT
jgi:hypothetical protein